MLDITPQLRRELRAKAHHLHPVVSVGQHGLSPSVLHEIDVALSAHGLIKVRVFSEDRDERDRMLVTIADELEASPVQHLGKLLIVYRPLPKTPPKRKALPKPAKRASGTASRRPTSKQPMPKTVRRQKPNAERPFAPIARRTREAGTTGPTDRADGSTASRPPAQRRPPRDEMSAPRANAAGAGLPRRRERSDADAPPASGGKRRAFATKPKPVSESSAPRPRKPPSGAPSASKVEREARTRDSGARPSPADVDPAAARRRRRRV